MKLLASSLAQLFAIIVITITFAVSLAALSLWADSGAQTIDVQQQQASSIGAGLP
jgi:hypothetical protein